MKRFFTLVCLVLCAFTLAVISFAHPGGTDGSGGHYNHDTGEYHYHHGYPEHQHEDGVCPYDYDDKTEAEETKSVLEQVFKGVIEFLKEFGFTYLILLSVVGLIYIVDYFKNRYSKK